MEETLFLSIIVPFTNIDLVLLRCLEALRDLCARNGKSEIVAVHWGKHVSIEEKLFADIRLIETEGRCFGDAIEAAVNLAKGRLCALVPPTWLISENFVERIAQKYQMHGCKIGGGMLDFGRGTNITDALNADEIEAIQLDRGITVSRLEGANLFFERTLFIEINGFDGLLSEENWVEAGWVLSRRLVEQGYRLYFYTDIVIRFIGRTKWSVFLSRKRRLVRSIFLNLMVDKTWLPPMGFGIIADLVQPVVFALFLLWFVYRLVSAELPLFPLVCLGLLFLYPLAPALRIQRKCALPLPKLLAAILLKNAVAVLGIFDALYARFVNRSTRAR